MKIDGACHCGYITYVAEVDPDKAGHMPLHGLSDLIGVRLSHECPRGKGSV